MDLDDLPKVRSTRDQVEATLTRLIEQQRPGDQLPPEPQLARQLGVSRPTLREVLRTFAERGLVVRRQGVGTFVASRMPVLKPTRGPRKPGAHGVLVPGLTTEMTRLIRRSALQRLWSSNAWDVARRQKFWWSAA